MSAALERLVTILVFGVLPVVAAVSMIVFAYRSDTLAIDFHRELYPESKEILAGNNPFPDESHDFYSNPNFIWPPVAAYLAAPLTLLEVDTADVVIAVIGLICFMLSLRIVGVRDWRVYGAFALWPQVIGEVRVSHLTPLLCLLVAIAWRYRNSNGKPGVAIGFAGALKFFLWPVGLWLAAIGRAREMLLAAAIAGASLLLVLPFTGLDDYMRALLELGRTFDQDAYSPFGLLLQLGAPETFSRVVTFVLGGGLLLLMWRWGSLGLAVAAALVLSPIVWLDFYALAAIPLATVMPRLGVVWLIPLVTWGLPSAGIGAGTTWGITRALVAFTIVFAVIVRAERAAKHDLESHAATVRPRVNRRLEPRSSPD
jgi:hypothetical protein